MAVYFLIILLVYVFESSSGDLRSPVNSLQQLSNTSLSLPAVCLEPVKVGPCRKNVQRYFYNHENGKCELFSYGGCGGTGNNFETYQHCVTTCKSSLTYLSPNEECRGVKCPGGGLSHYRELGCQPVYDDGACCPTRFDCPDRKAEKNSSQCIYKGKVFSIGENMPEADSGPGCRESCSCSSSGINCAHVECAELFGYYPSEECRIGLYKRGDCCAFDYACGNETTICEFEGRKYVEGEKIYPQDESCLTCYCKPGFNGTLTSEYCELVDCGIEIWYSKQLALGCTPVYYVDSKSRVGCCPVSWHCPQDADNEEISKESTSHENETVAVSSKNETKNKSQSAGLLTRLAAKTQLVSRDEICRQPKDQGNCMASRNRYFYSNETERCEEFIYTGCKGNLNNFLTYQDCLRTCVFQKEESITGRLGFSIQIDVTSTTTDPCTQEVRAGRCKAYFPRYYFNPAANRCQLFIYGGCGRNDNNFRNKESCEATCLRSDTTAICTKKPLDTIMSCGKERNYKYYYDAAEGRCKQFLSTGCSTESFFTQFEECQAKCVPETPIMTTIPNSGRREDYCNLPLKRGSCYANIPSYYYDSSSNLCKPFIYGGCFGNRNRFGTMESCNKSCVEMAPHIPLIPVGSQVAFERAAVANPSASTEPANNANMVFTDEAGRPIPIIGTGTDSTSKVHSPPQDSSPFLFSSSLKMGKLRRREIHQQDNKEVVDENETTEGSSDKTSNVNSAEVKEDPVESVESTQSTGEGKVPAEITHGEEIMSPSMDKSVDNDTNPVGLEGIHVERESQLGEYDVVYSSTDSSTDTDSPGTTISPVLVQNETSTAQYLNQTRMPTFESQVGHLNPKVPCDQPVNKGNCSQAVVRFFWNGHQCRPFNYTGCGGNENRFSTEFECYRTCGNNFESSSRKFFCVFGNKFIPFGANLQDNELCGSHFCTCSIPPGLTCTLSSCP